MQRSHPNGQFVAAEWLGVGKKYISEELPVNSESESAGFTLSEADCTLFEGWTEPDCLSQITSTMKEFTKRKSGKDVDAIDEY